MTRNNSRWTPLITLPFAATLAACGGSGIASPPAATASPTAASVSTPTASAASVQCPTGATVGSALGMTVPNAVGVPGGGSAQLPPGASGMICDYHGAAGNVIVEVLMNINPSFIDKFSVHFPVPYKTVPGLGDQARSFFAPLGGGTDNEGVVATKGSTLVAIDATATPASLSQVEALVSQLL